MLESAEALALIARINVDLATVYRGESMAEKKERRQAKINPAPVGMPALYQIEFMKNLARSSHAFTVMAANTERHDEYLLRVTRREKSATTTVDGNTVHMSGARFVISEYEVSLQGLETSSGITTFLAPECMHDSGRYLCKGFGRLLMHLLVYCCACARLRMQIFAVHPTTVKLYGEYRAAGYASARVKSNTTTDFTIDTTAGGAAAAHSEAAAGGAAAAHSEAAAGRLTVSDIEDLKALAVKNIDSTLEAMTLAKHTTLSENMYVVPWPPL